MSENLTEDQIYEEDGMIINKSKNTFTPKDPKELKFLEDMYDKAIEEIKAGKYKPIEEFEW